MTEEQARAAVRAAITKVAPEAEDEPLDDGDELQGALELDSMDFLNVVIGLKEQTGVTVPEKDYGRVRTFGGMVSYLVEQSA